MSAGKYYKVQQKNLRYKNSVIYGLDVKLFKDRDRDSAGDLKGLISVATIWIPVN